MLRAFEMNPFRLLRLDVDSSTSTAANQAENALTLERVGLALDDPDLLPWLPPGGSYELQRAAQNIEEPLVRLKHQMLWFDGVRDPRAALLKEALREPTSKALQQYLSDEIELPPAQVLGAESELLAAEPVSSPWGTTLEACPFCGADLPRKIVRGVENWLSTTDSRCERCGRDVNIIGDEVAMEKSDDREGAKAKRGADITCDSEISFWDAIRGTEVSVKVTSHDVCGDCGGSGKSKTEATGCPSCKGDVKAKKSCLRCDGSGRLPVACANCRGAGGLERIEELKVKVPPGVQSGMRTRLQGKGEAGKDGLGPGDLYVTFKVQPHALLQRNGNDIRIDVPITSMEAASGTELEVPTINGPIVVRIPKETKSGQNFRLPGRGVSDVRNGRRGDQYFGIAVETSEQCAHQLRKQLAELSQQIKSADAGNDKKRGAPVARVSPPADCALVARAINQANLRLLVAAATIDGALARSSTSQTEVRKISPEQWKPLNGFAVLANAHSIFVGSLAGVDTAFGDRSYWSNALRHWTQILAHPWFRYYVEACIVDLGDDYVSADDVETIEESVRAQLLDLSAQEARSLVLEGRYVLAGSLISAMAASGMEARVITPATRPLRHVFQAELSELESLLEQASDSNLESVDAYLRRLESIKARWVDLDTGDIVGLRNLLDEAVEKAYLRLRSLEKPDKSVDALLTRVGNIASAQSLRERVSSFQNELVESRNRLCYFCKTERPNYEKSVVLRGQKETGRERHFNSTTIHYAIRYGIVLRCGRCARLHDFIRKTGLAFWLLGAPGFLIVVGWFIGQIFS